MNSQNKKIEKMTRSHSQRLHDYKFNHNPLYTTSKLFHKTSKSVNPKNKDNDQRMNCNEYVKGQKIVVDLNLGQFGFDIKVKENSHQQIQKILTNSQLFAINPNIVGFQWKQLSSEITNQLQKQKFLINSKPGNKVFLYELQSQNMIEINKEKSILLQCIHQLLSRIKQGSTSPGLVGTISSEVLATRQILHQTNQSLNNYRQIQRKDEIKDLICNLQKHIAFKTFSQGLKYLVIDELNYFLFKQFQENSRNGKLQNPIKNWQEWALFIKKKRRKLRKADKFLLHTACQFCLSSYTQQLNPIQNCSQCHIRGHRLCLGNDKNSRCGRCIYLRLSNQVKKKIPECFICSVKNLGPLRITSSKFVHIFCLMAHGLWDLSNSSIQIQKNIFPRNQNTKICKFCNKVSSFYTSCIKCGQFSHYLCAHMQGSCFQVSQQQKVILNCCQLNKESAKKIADQRKYILNYNNIIFRKSDQIQKSNKKCRKGKIKQRKKQRLLNRNNNMMEQYQDRYENDCLIQREGSDEFQYQDYE